MTAVEKYKKLDLMGLNLKLLFCAGVVPTPGIASSSWKLKIFRMYPSLMVLLYCLVLTAQFLAFFKFWGDLDAITDNAFTMVGVFMCYMQAAYVVTHTARLLRLVEGLETSVTPHELITSTSRKTKFFTWTMFIIVHGMLSTWIAGPIGMKYSSVEHVTDSNKPSPYFCFIIWLPFDALRSPTYEIVYVIQTLCFLMASLYYTSINTVFITLIIHTATQFRLVALSFSNSDQNPEQYLTDCIKRHQAVIRFAKELDAVLSPLLLFYFFCSQLIMCVVIFQVVLSWGQGKSVVKFVLGFAAACCGPLMFCWFGTDIIQESLAVQEAAYGCAWYNRPTSFKRLLAMVIMRAQKPVRLTAGIFYDVSLATFTQMLNTVYTYFAVLKQLYDDK